MTFNFRSHEPIMKDGQPAGYKVTPYQLFASQDMVIAYQDGLFYGYGGTPLPLEEVPDYVWNAIDHMFDEAKQRLGLDKIKRPGAATSKKAAA